MKKYKKIGYTSLLVVVIAFSLSFKSSFFEIAKQLEIFTTLFKELNIYYIDEINPGELMTESIKNTLDGLDPYTKYYNEQDVEDAKIIAEGEYGGIGASIMSVDGKLIVREVFQGYPADKAELKAGDIILKIDSVSVSDQKVGFARNLLVGLPGTELTLKIDRQGKQIEKNVKRETVELDPVPFYQIIDETVGYIAFEKFNKKASEQVGAAIEDLKSQGMTSLIIDVRHNPGGLLHEVIKIVNFFIPKNKVVVTTKAKVNKWSNTYLTKNNPIDTEMPIVVLIDNKSASASEILAGALQDYDRAVILGKRSYGKGLVQRTRKLAYGTQLKLTISKYYTPSGRCIQELDYAHRDGKKIPKFSDYGKHEFKTEGGRIVYDGGGVTPDILMDTVKQSEIIKRFLNSQALFNYTTSYYYKNKSIANPEDVLLTSKDFERLKEYLIEHPESFELKTEKSFEDLLTKAHHEGLYLDQEYELIRDKINQEKVALLSNDQDKILDILSYKIINRYYYKEGEYQRKVKKDPYIQEAVNVLKDTLKYQSILN